MSEEFHVSSNKVSTHHDEGEESGKGNKDPQPDMEDFNDECNFKLIATEVLCLLY